MAGARPARAGGRPGLQRGQLVSAADSMRLRRPQRLVLVAAVLVVLAALGSIIVPLLHLPAALLAVPALVGLAALLPIAQLFSHLRRAAELATQAQRLAETQRL